MMALKKINGNNRTSCIILNTNIADSEIFGSRWSVISITKRAIVAMMNIVLTVAPTYQKNLDTLPLYFLCKIEKA